MALGLIQRGRLHRCSCLTVEQIQWVLGKSAVGIDDHNGGRSLLKGCSPCVRKSLSGLSQSGDWNAFEVLLESYRTLLSRTAYWTTRDFLRALMKVELATQMLLKRPCPTSCLAWYRP